MSSSVSEFALTRAEIEPAEDFFEPKRNEYWFPGDKRVEAVHFLHMPEERAAE